MSAKPFSMAFNVWTSGTDGTGGTTARPARLARGRFHFGERGDEEIRRILKKLPTAKAPTSQMPPAGGTGLFFNTKSTKGAKNTKKCGANIYYLLSVICYLLSVICARRRGSAPRA